MISWAKIEWTTVIVAVVSFLLGLIGNLVVQWWQDKKKLNRIKGALKLHLRDIILSESITLKNEYERIIHHIQEGGHVQMGFKSCKRFDAEIYKANNPSDYYKIYGKKENGKFGKLVSTYAIVSYLKENLPAKIYSNYLNEVNQNFNNYIGQYVVPQNHSEYDRVQKNLISNNVALCRDYIVEIDMLIKLIGEFTS